ncbi:MAG: polysaccharide lyase family protein [Pirellulales bacterium]
MSITCQGLNIPSFRKRLLQLVLAVLVCALAWGPVLPALATPTITDLGGVFTVSNGITSFEIDHSNNKGGLRSLKLNGQELVSGGHVYFDANVADFGGTSNGTYWNLQNGNNSYSYTTGGDFVDVAISHSASATMPFDVTTHYVMRDGEQGFHLYNEFEHTAAMADKSLVQTRMVMRGDAGLFTHHSVTDTRFGIMPTASELQNGTEVQDATTRLNPGTAYEAETGKDVYTKYDWSLDHENKDVIGFYGDAVGAWIVQPHKESQTGGPPKQHLTVHQTETTPVLLGMLTSLHYGTSKQIDFAGDKSQTFGPFYVHLNTGPDHTTLRADAATYDAPSVHRSFYDSLSIPGWTQTVDRSNVTGLLNLAGGGDVGGATIVLSDNNTDFQFATGGHQFWSKSNSDGTFDISSVRPGTYRLTAYAPGTYGELIMDDVVVGTGTTLNMGNLDWQPPDHGQDLWQIGTFDRTGEEYLHGANDEYRQYGLWFDYPTEFPGGVNFVIGQSDEATDWNYAHWESSQSDWKIEFEADAIPEGRTATMTMAIAGHRNGRVMVYVNGTLADIYQIPNSGSVLPRSGIYGAYSSKEISFTSSLLVAGTNTIALRHVNPNQSPTNTEGIVYDAIRLEIESLDGDFDADNDVDGHDFLKWQRGQSPAPFSQTDLNAWQANYGTVFTPDPPGDTVLIADADTNIEESGPDDIEGGLDRMQVRSRDVAGTGRQHISYVRFDLQGETSISEAIFTLVTNNTTGWLSGQVQVYGLNGVVGNTPQDWNEATLSYNSSGEEVPGDGDATTQDLGTIGTSGAENLWLLGDLSTLNPNPNGELVDFSSAELVNFLNSRAGGLATLLIVNADGTDRSLLFRTREYPGFAPTLTLNPTEGALASNALAVPEPASSLLLLGGILYFAQFRLGIFTCTAGC